MLGENTANLGELIFEGLPEVQILILMAYWKIVDLCYKMEYSRDEKGCFIPPKIHSPRGTPKSATCSSKRGQRGGFLVVFNPFHLSKLVEGLLPKAISDVKFMMNLNMQTKCHFYSSIKSVVWGTLLFWPCDCLNNYQKFGFSTKIWLKDGAISH